MQTHIYDAIVIGAGGMGSAAAYHLAKAGANVLLLEQFHRGHSHGSSHGETRIIRLFYDKPFYTELMKSAYAEWRALETDSGTALLSITGSISIGVENNRYGRIAHASLEAAGVESEWWGTEQRARHFPQFNIEKGTDILWQKDTGFLHAASCIDTQLRRAEHHGADIRENVAVTRIVRDTDIPSVETENGHFRARKIIVTAGAWTARLLDELTLPLTVTRQQACYYHPSAQATFQPGQFPVFVETTASGEFLYGIPQAGKNGVKIARHGRGQPTSPDTCDRTADADYIQHVDAYVQQRLPGLGQATRAEVCLYTETPDEDFIIDVHPEAPNLLIAAGFSGHGFKFCALVGRILCELAANGETAFDISQFSINRFSLALM